MTGLVAPIADLEAIDQDVHAGGEAGISEPGFTPGPWVQFIDRAAGELQILPAGRPGVIARLQLAENGDANGYAIGALPELYSALECARALIDELLDDGVSNYSRNEEILARIDRAFAAAGTPDTGAER